MWPFDNKSTLKPSEKTRLNALELAYDELRHDLDRLTKQHQKLSGAFYGRGGTTPAPKDDPVSMKAQMRLRLGLMPGRPPPKTAE